MKRTRWLGVLLVVCISIAFLFAGPQVKEKKTTEPDKRNRECIKTVPGLEALEMLHDFDVLHELEIDLSGLEIDLSGLEALKDLEIRLDAVEAWHALDLSVHLEGLHEALEGLKHLRILDHMDMDFDFDWDDFDFDFDFDFDWSGFDFDWDWGEDNERDDSPEAQKKIKK